MTERRHPYRERVHACIHPETYKYFFTRDQVVPLWRALEARYGPIQGRGAFKMMEIDAEHFWLRAVVGGNPITVIRKRACPPAAIDELHAIFGLAEPCA